MNDFKIFRNIILERVFRINFFKVLFNIDRIREYKIKIIFNRMVCIVLKWIKWDILLFLIMSKNKVRNIMKLEKGIFW